MWQRRSRAALIGVLGIIALTPAGAGADPVLPFSVYGHYFFGGEFDAGFVTAGSRRYFGPNHDTLLTLPAVNTGGIGGAGSELNIQLSGSAAPGTLRAFAQVTADSSTVLTDGRSWGTAEVEVGFTDSFTVGHSTLPIGTQISFEFGAVLHSTLALIGPPSCNPGDPIPHGGFLYIILTPSYPSHVGRTICNDPGYGPPGSGAQTVTQIVSARVGDTVILESLLRIGIMAGAPPGQFSRATGDAANTANFFVSPLTPGVTLTSASGAPYTLPAAVPEPASVALFGSGLAALWARRRAARPAEK